MKDSKVYLNFKIDGEEYKIFNKCINEYLINEKKLLDTKVIDDINKLLNKINKNDYKIIDAYLEVKGYQINSIEEILELLKNINDYKLLEVNNIIELGKLILKKATWFDVLDDIIEFIDIEKLAKNFLNIYNIKYVFCSNGTLLYIKDMFANDLVEESINPEYKIKLLITNKNDYEEENYNKRVEIFFPTTEKKLDNKLKLLDIENSDIQILDFSPLIYNEKEKKYMTLVMEKIIRKLNIVKKETLLSDVQDLAYKIQKLDNVKIQIFIALLESKKTDINSFRDVVNLIDEIKNYELLSEIKNLRDIGKYLVNETSHFDDINVLLDYINYERLAEDYTKVGCTYNGTFTSIGYLMKKKF